MGAAGIGAISTVAADEPPDRHIVGTSTPKAAGAADRSADAVHGTRDDGPIGQAVAGRFPRSALEALRDNPNVRSVERDGRMEALAETLPWSVDRVDADVNHANGDTGNGADVAILDTGLDADHYGLQDNIAGGECFADDCCGQASGGIFGCGDNSNDCNQPVDTTPYLSLRPLSSCCERSNPRDGRIATAGWMTGGRGDPRPNGG